AMSVAYAAPELFEGRTSRWSDQYSLAVSYCELRAGRLPFLGAPAELMAGHLTRPPDLTMLPEAERTIVARALAKTPAHGWRPCLSFGEALQGGKSTGRAGATEPVGPRKKREGRSRRWALRALLVLLLCAGGTAGALIGRAVLRPRSPE